MPRALKLLVQVRTSTLVGAPYRMGIGSAVSRGAGVTQDRLEALVEHATSPVFTEVERLADELARTPASVPDVPARLLG